MAQCKIKKMINVLSNNLKMVIYLGIDLFPIHSLYHWRSSSHLMRGQLINVEKIKKPYGVIRSDPTTNKAVGAKAIIAAVRKALLVDIFIRIYK